MLLNGTEVSLDLVLLAATPLRGAHRRISITTSRCLSPSFLGCDGTLHRARDGRAACRPRPRMGFEGLLQVGDGATAAGAKAARNWSLIPSFNFGAQRWRKRSAAGALAPSVAHERLHVGKGLRTGRAARHSSDSYCRLLGFDLCLHGAGNGRAACRLRPCMGFEGLLQVGDGATAAGARAARNWSLIPSFSFGAQRWRKRSAFLGTCLAACHPGAGQGRPRTRPRTLRCTWSRQRQRVRPGFCTQLQHAAIQVLSTLVGHADPATHKAVTMMLLQRSPITHAKTRNADCRLKNKGKALRP